MTTEPEIRILKKGTCPSLTAQSDLDYQIGCDDESTLLIRISGNTGNGHFNKHWVRLHDLLELIADAGELFSYSVLHAMFKGKSVNTACFLMAALKNEGLVEAKDRRYVRKDPETVMANFKKLMSPKTTRKTPTRKQSAAA